MIRSLSLRFFIIIAVLVACIWVASSMSDTETVMNFVRQWGYLGLGILSIISGFNLVAPIPAVAFIPVIVAAGLNFWVALALVTVGMTIGDAVGIFLGKTGRSIMDEWVSITFINKLERFIKRFKIGPYAGTFLYSAFIPLPNELLIVPLSFLKVNAYKLLLAAFLGNIVFNTLIAWGLVGITSLVSGV